MAKMRYTRELLDELLRRDNAELLGDYNSIGTKTNISFKCHCGEHGEKLF